MTAAAATPASAAASAAPEETAPERPRGAERTRLDPEQDRERLSLWQRLREGMGVPDLDDARVRKWEQYYVDRPEYRQRMFERGGRYLFHIVEEIDQRGLPLELALLPFVESAFNPQALSRARASGMWQFMPGTGRAFELRQNVFRDDRRDVLASTRAALDFLQGLHARFGDWHLALAAYNWGPGNVQRALDRARRSKRPTDYAQLRGMPRETRDYVPKLQAMKNIVMRPESFGVELPKLENHPYFVSVPIERDIDVELAARLAGLSLDEFHQLNPQLNRPLILAAGTPQILLPYDNANRFVRALAAHRGPTASWTAWVAPRTLKPAEAAKLHGMSEAELRDINLIPPRMIVQRGSTLLVPRRADGAPDVSAAIADNGEIKLVADGLRRVSLRVGRHGDTVRSVARRYRLKPEDVARWNDVGLQARFAPNTHVIVMLPDRRVRATRSSSRRAPAATAAGRTGSNGNERRAAGPEASRPQPGS